MENHFLHVFCFLFFFFCLFTSLFIFLFNSLFSFSFFLPLNLFSLVVPHIIAYVRTFVRPYICTYYNQINQKKLNKSSYNYRLLQIDEKFFHRQIFFRKNFIAFINFLWNFTKKKVLHVFFSSSTLKHRTRKSAIFFCYFCLYYQKYSVEWSTWQ